MGPWGGFWGVQNSKISMIAMQRSFFDTLSAFHWHLHCFFLYYINFSLYFFDTISIFFIVFFIISKSSHTPLPAPQVGGFVIFNLLGQWNLNPATRQPGCQNLARLDLGASSPPTWQKAPWPSFPTRLSIESPATRQPGKFSNLATRRVFSTWQQHDPSGQVAATAR